MSGGQNCQQGLFVFQKRVQEVMRGRGGARRVWKEGMIRISFQRRIVRAVAILLDA
jgi:hypothetical protein